METLFSFPPGKRRQIVPVRRDPKFSPQLYFMSTETSGRDLLASFEQAIWDRESNQITCCVVYKQLVDHSDHRILFAVDERDKVLHLVQDGGDEVRVERIDLAFEKPDNFGYRRANVSSVSLAHGQLLVTDAIVLPSGVDGKTFDISVAAINIFPSTAELILHFKYVHRKNLEIGHFPRLVGADRPSFRTLDEELEARSHIVSRSNDILTLISYHDRNPPADKKEEKKRKRAVMGLPDGLMMLHSYDTHVQQINTLGIDPVQLLQSFLPKSVLDGLKAEIPMHMPQFMFFGAHLQLLGHVHKYVLFFFHHNYVLAAKWPKNWYKFGQVPEIKQKRLMCVDKQKKHGEIRDVWIGSTDLYFKVELEGVETIRRMNLGHKFKDYRTYLCVLWQRGERKKEE